MRKAQKIVADLPCARTEVITSGAHIDFVVAEHSLQLSGDHALVCGPQAAHGWIGDAWMVDGIAILERTEQPVGSCGARHTAQQGPRDASAGIADDHVLPRNSDARSHRQHIIDAARALEIEQPEIGRFGPGGKPRGLQALTAGHILGIVLTVEHDAGADVPIDDFDGRLAFDGDGLAAHAELGARTLAPARVGEISIAVGESPGHLAVGTRGDCRRSGKRDAGDVDGGIARDAQARRVPHGRNAEIEMHVIGDERYAGARVHAGHRPVVAAGRDRLFRRFVRRTGETQLCRK